MAKSPYLTNQSETSNSDVKNDVYLIFYTNPIVLIVQPYSS